ncbi:MAG: endolytic transglycosylase MltG [Faecalibacterium sp.]|nr:endolytic transglycosylase MltG [Ruminococcus sp.]MCM1391217.1 endolytic transglycosylase MltG [Ruminococcus sp.]MCM1485655.1 endolytic transglycosylase MltG [Faecalibacterium sp.]
MKKTIILFTVIFMLLLCGCSAAVEQSDPNISDSITESPTATVTFPEGYSAVQIAKKLEENNVCSAEDFMNEVNNIEAVKDVYTFASKIDNINDRAFALEGYIFPDTYEFYRNESAKSALGRFLKNTDRKLSDEYYTRAEELGYSMDEIITLASIIQKEAGIKAEMSKVSSVLHNRIVSPDYGKLQCDVTINYVNDYITDSPYLDSDTEKFAPLYNTYKCKGLPSGAICNPGIDAIKAALYPGDTNYFYFVTDPEKNYYYAETYEQHLKNCKICGIG